MRILVDGMPRRMGGIGSLILNIVEYNNQLGLRESREFEFLVPAGSSYIETLKDKGYVFYECPRVSRIRQYRQFVRGLLKTHSFDYVWINNTSKVNLMLPRAAKRSGAKVITHAHGTVIEEHGLRKLAYQMLEALQQRSFDRQIDVPLACSEAAADYFYRDKELRSRCQIVQNGIFADRFLFDPLIRSRIREELGIGEDAVLLGSAGRLTELKNYPFLLKVIGQLDGRFVCLLLGDGEDRETLTEQIRAMGLEDRVLLIGRKPNVNEYLFAMDIFVMPSFSEGLPFALIEAQAAGLPCCVSEGVPETAKLTGDVCFLPLDRTEAWVGKIREYAQKKPDRVRMNSEVRAAGYGIETGYATFFSRLNEER